mgnify:CR=1 FL=1
MKYCQVFKDKLKCNNPDDVFTCLINNLKETIKTWDYFVNWDKVIKKLQRRRNFSKLVKHIDW